MYIFHYVEEPAVITMLPADQTVLSEGFVTFLFLEISGIPAGGLGCDVEVTLDVTEGFEGK